MNIIITYISIRFMRECPSPRSDDTQNQSNIRAYIQQVVRPIILYQARKLIIILIQPDLSVEGPSKIGGKLLGA